MPRDGGYGLARLGKTKPARGPRGRLSPPGSPRGPRLGLGTGISVVTRTQAGLKDRRSARGPKAACAAVATPSFPNTTSTHRTRPATSAVRMLVTKVARGSRLSPRVPERCRCQQRRGGDRLAFPSIFPTKARGWNARHRGQTPTGSRPRATSGQDHGKKASNCLGFPSRPLPRAEKVPPSLGMGWGGGKAASKSGKWEAPSSREAAVLHRP